MTGRATKGATDTRSGSGRSGKAAPAIAAFSDALQDEAESAWRFPRLPAVALFVLPFVGAPIVAFTHLYKPLFVFFTAEDRFLEWLQFLGYAAAGILAARAAATLSRRGVPRAVTVAWILLAVGCVGVAGEEISWGQRIFEWETPDALEEVNLQEETTVHNIDVVQTMNNGALLLVGFYGSLAPFLARRMRWRRFLWLFVPPIFLTGAFFILFAFKLGRFTVIPHYDAIVEFGEWPEFCLALALCAYAGLVVRRLRSTSFGS